MLRRAEKCSTAIFNELWNLSHNPARTEIAMVAAAEDYETGSNYYTH
jgi:hypothetical protein